MSEYAPGTQIPGTQYRVVRLLGAGGHGSVYAVEHVFLEAPFVLKILHGEHADEKDLTQRMMREARTLAKLRHPNIVEVHDGGLTTERPKRPFFVMESLNGMPLRSLLREVRGGIGVLPALRIVIGLLNGLHYAHSAGVIHRDVKPDNIFLHKSESDVTVAKILDFGIAHLLLGKRMTGRMFLGTPRYSAPEQLRGEGPTAQTDIYAAGLVLYELLTGEVPHAQHRDMHGIVGAHLNEDLPAASGRAREVPAALDRFVATMTAKAPTDRPVNAFAAAVALREVRSFIEAARSTSIHAPDFKTEPTPMENVLVEASPDEVPIVTEIGAPVSSISSTGNDTMPDAQPVFATMRDHDPALSTTESSPGPVGGMQGAAGAAVDRNARTNTAKRRESAPPRAKNDTDVMSPESLARGLLDAVVDSAPGAERPVPLETAEPATTAALAMSRTASSSSAEAPAVVDLPRARLVSSVVAGSIVLISCVVAWTIATRSGRASEPTLEPRIEPRAATERANVAEPSAAPTQLTMTTVAASASAPASVVSAAPAQRRPVMTSRPASPVRSVQRPRASAAPATTYAPAEIGFE